MTTPSSRPNFNNPPTPVGGIREVIFLRALTEFFMVSEKQMITEAGEKPVVGAADISAAIEEATKAGKNSVLLLVSKAGKQAEMRFIALKLKK